MCGFKSIRFYSWTLLAILALMLVTGCGSEVGPPIDALKDSMKNEPTYSIILENMKEEGNFIKSFFHQIGRAHV